VAVAALRRHVVATQGYAARARRGTRAEVGRTIAQLGCVQLDSVTAVERAHRLTLGARVGTYPRDSVSKLLAKGQVFEYWAHEACLLPVSSWPLFMAEMRSREHPWWGPVIERDPTLHREVLDAIRERGPLGSRDFEGKSGGAMWQLKPAKRMLEALWTAGELVICGRRNFQRLYDLPERVLPAEVLNAPMPSAAERERLLVEQAVHARGALTLSAVVEHWRLRGGVARIRGHAGHLVEEGRLRQLTLDDGGADVLVPPGDLREDGSAAAVLLSPFDNLIWDRPFTERLFGFKHVIEIYKRPHERVYGYYVLPLLFGDRIIARCDLKTERDADRLRLRALHPEPKVRWTAGKDAALEKALARLAGLIGVSSILREA